MTKLKTSWHQSQLAGFLSPGTLRKADSPLDVLLLQKWCCISAVGVVLCEVHTQHVQGPVFHPQNPNKQTCCFIKSIYAVIEDRKSNMDEEGIGFPQRWDLGLWFFKVFLLSVSSFSATHPNLSRLALSTTDLVGWGWKGGQASR